MKTKNVLIVAALSLSGILNVNNLFAKDNDNVKLNIVLKPIQTITVNTATDHKTVNLEYSTIQKYNDGVSSAQLNNHLEVFSTGGFVVNVNTDGDFKNTKDAEKTILASDVSVLATRGEGNTTGAGSQKQLSASATELITSDKGGRELKYDVTYINTAGAKDKYIDKYIAADGTESVYTATVTYTIAAR